MRCGEHEKARGSTLVASLCVIALLAVATPWTARAQVGADAGTAPLEVTEVEPPLEVTEVEPPREVTEVEPEVGTWTVLGREPEAPSRLPRYWMAADLTYAEGLREFDRSRSRAGRLTLEARALLMAQVELALRWALGYVATLDSPAAPERASRVFAGNPGISLTYLRQLPAVEVRLGAEFVVALEGAPKPDDESRERRFLMAIDGAQDGWRFAAGATTVVLEASIESRGGPVWVGARAAYAFSLGPAATLFISTRLAALELGLRVGGGVLDVPLQHGRGPALSSSLVRGVALTPYVRFERPAYFGELHATYANVGQVSWLGDTGIVWSTGVGAGAHF